MTVVDDIAALLKADTGSGKVATLLTGGIYTFEETGKLGINRDSTPNAFSATTGQLKPCLVVKGRSQVPDNGIWDDATQDLSYRQIVELWFYDAGDAGYSTIRAARDRAFELLHGKTVGSSKLIPRLNSHPVLEGRDTDLGHAAMCRSDYEIRGLA